MRDRVTSQDGVLKSKRAMAFVRKVALDCLSLQLMPLLWLTCSMCDQDNLSGRANVLCNVRRGAVLRASVTLSA